MGNRLNGELPEPILAKLVDRACNSKSDGFSSSSSSAKRMLKKAHRARYVLVEPDLLLKDALVHVSNAGRISRVESWRGHPLNPGVEVVDWGSAIIMPGLVNAHAHLELTSLHNQLTRFDCFTDWIMQLINRRQLWTAEDFIASAREGARLSLASGTTLAGDITSSGVGWTATSGQNLRRVVFEEAVAFSPDQAQPALRQLNCLIRHASPNPLLVHGISPHAPYSVSSKLYKLAAKRARNCGMSLATHVAETRAELEFVQDGTGEFKEFLKARNVLPADWKPPRLSPVCYLDSLGVLGPSCLLVHCNYLDQESIRRIRNTRSSVVYCPRSHDFFSHEKHPVRQLLDNGINVALGTDSLASNTTLSMIDEMRFLYRNRKDLKSEEVFRAATSNGAVALGFGSSLGRLRRGYLADMTLLGLPPNLKQQHLLDQILEGNGKCIATIVQGQLAWKRGEKG
jgi:cytosine/adenosine deaminase-related metal-dependent hydrolase